MRGFLFLFLILVLSVLFIISNNNLAMYKTENLTVLKESYFSWINQIFSNTRSLTGEAVKLEWFPPTEIIKGNI